MQDLRAGPSVDDSYVYFVNKTPRSVNLYWIDYEGRQRFYLTLKPSDFAKVNTYRTHPWVFRDEHTGECMQVGHEYKFWPKKTIMRDPKNPSRFLAFRMLVGIHLPVRTLREHCLWSMLNTLTQRNRKSTQIENDEFDVENIDKLFIPNTLKTDLRTLQETMNIYHKKDSRVER